MTGFISELQRRNVHKIAAAYAFGGWILIEAGSVLLPTFGAPEWLFRYYAVLVIVGFFLALALSWAFEWTPEGVKRDRDLDRHPAARGSGRKMNYAIIGLLLVALTISVTLNLTGMRETAATAQTAAARQSIAVLPFANLSTDPDNAYFADGIHDDVLTSLANIDALKVISRTSVLEYRDTKKNLRQIGEDLGVDTVLEGAVRRSGDSVRVTVQLIDAATDEHIWARTFDRGLSARGIFEIQSEISMEISSALRAQLTSAEQGRLRSVPTESMEAYRLNVLGRRNLYERRLEALLKAREQFRQAIELDPNYAQPYSGLADSVMLLYINHQAVARDEALEVARHALDKAIAIDGGDADSYASLGLLNFHLAMRNVAEADFTQAEAAFRRAIELNPSHATAYMWFASLREFQGRIEEALGLYHRSLEVDPVGRIPLANIGALYSRLGRNEEALAQWLDALRIYPDWPLLYEHISMQLATTGRYDEAVAWGLSARDNSDDPLLGLHLIPVYMLFGDTRRALALIETLEPGHPLFELAAPMKRIVQGEFEEGITLIDRASAAGIEIPDVMLDITAQAAVHAGALPAAREYTLRRFPEFGSDALPALHEKNVAAAVRLAYIAREQGDAARSDALLEAALPVVQSLPRFGIVGQGVRDVEIHALRGRPDLALATLRIAIDQGYRGPVMHDIGSLRDNPYLSSLKDYPEYAALLAELDRYVAAMRERVELAHRTGNWEALLQLAEAGDTSRS